MVDSDKIITYKDNQFVINQFGFLKNLEDYNDIWVEYIMKLENISELTDTHKRIITYVRNYYNLHGEAPNIHSIMMNLNITLKDIYCSFKEGINTICVISGLPETVKCYYKRYIYYHNKS